jgi:hypothetical protein
LIRRSLPPFPPNLPVFDLQQVTTAGQLLCDSAQVLVTVPELSQKVASSLETVKERVPSSPEQDNDEPKGAMDENSHLWTKSDISHHSGMITA